MNVYFCGGLVDLRMVVLCQRNSIIAARNLLHFHRLILSQ